MDEAFRIAERIDTKARQALALAAAVFAVTQAVAFGTFARGEISDSERAALIVAAALAAIALAVVAECVARAERLRRGADVDPDAIVKWCKETSPDDSAQVTLALVEHLGRAAIERRDSNRARKDKYDQIVKATRAAIAVSGVELAVALAVRI